MRELVERILEEQKKQTKLLRIIIDNQEQNKLLKRESEFYEKIIIPGRKGAIRRRAT